MDFTLNKYRELLVAIQKAGYKFITFEEYCNKKESLPYPFVILRHDVDLLPQNSLDTAKVENRLGITATYYFRVVPESNNPKIIREIASLGHEIGYHYEDMSLFKGRSEHAITHFESQLEYFRQYYPVKTICMHGSPRSKFDAKDLWKEYSYSNYGIIGEPYFDVNWDNTLYLTDTGRCWDGCKVSRRDKVESHQELWDKKGWCGSSTDDIKKLISDNREIKSIMITTHPQRWTNNPISWSKEYILQNLKNIIKRFI